MKITIQEIDSSTAVTIPGTTQIGFPARFASSIVSGKATIVPSSGSSFRLGPGRSMPVEVKYEHVSRFHVVDGPTSAWMRPLNAETDYAVQGPIVFSYPSGDFGVQVGDCIVSLTTDDALGQTPQMGQWVAFHLHGLSFWGHSA